MIFAILRTALLNLRRDKGAFVMSFVLPVAFFSIFAVIFGATGNSGTAAIHVDVVDQDQSEGSKRFVKALMAETSLKVHLTPKPADGATAVPAQFTQETATAEVRGGTVPVALISATAP